jgi:hypothetical protein
VQNFSTGWGKGFTFARFAARPVMFPSFVPSGESLLQAVHLAWSGSAAT